MIFFFLPICPALDIYFTRFLWFHPFRRFYTGTKLEANSILIQYMLAKERKLAF